MSASAHVLSLVRSHYAGDERAFADSSLALARASKSVVVRNAITDAVRNRATRPRPAAPSLAPLLPLPPAAGGLLEPIALRSLDELVLPEVLRAELDEVALEIEYRSALSDRGLRPRNRLLFTGPPGCGKTSASAALAGRSSLSAYAVSLPELISKFVGETGSNIGKLFGSLNDSTLVVLDELDAIGATRAGVEQAAGKEFNGIVNTLLTMLDRRREGVLVATTNRLDILDPALVRRFDAVLEFPGPTTAQKLDLADRLARGFRVAAPHSDLVVGCEHFAAVEKLVEREARRAVMREILADGEGDEDGNEEES